MTDPTPPKPNPPVQPDPNNPSPFPPTPPPTPADEPAREPVLAPKGDDGSVPDRPVQSAQLAQPKKEGFWEKVEDAVGEAIGEAFEDRQ